MPAFFGSLWSCSRLSLDRRDHPIDRKKDPASTFVPLPAIWLYLLHFSQRQICDRNLVKNLCNYMSQLIVSNWKYGVITSQNRV